MTRWKCWWIYLVKLASALHVSCISTEYTVCLYSTVWLLGEKKKQFLLLYCSVCTDELVWSSDQTFQAGLRRGCNLSYASQPSVNEGKLQNWFVHHIYSLVTCHCLNLPSGLLTGCLLSIKSIFGHICTIFLSYDTCIFYHHALQDAVTSLAYFVRQQTLLSFNWSDCK
jgi:hypothetical protein